VEDSGRPRNGIASRFTFRPARNTKRQSAMLEVESPSRFGQLFAHDLRAHAVRLLRGKTAAHLAIQVRGRLFPDHAIAFVGIGE
jgi:hypothetical protein